MRSDDKYIDKPDDFARKVGNKLREHRIPVDPEVWDSLTDRLRPCRKPVFTYWSWGVAGVAVVLLSVLFLLNPFENELLLTEDSQSLEQIRKEKVLKPESRIQVAATTDQTGSPKPSQSAMPTEDVKPAEEIVELVDVLDPIEVAELSENEISGGIPVPEKMPNQEEVTRSEVEELPVGGLLAERGNSSPRQEQRGLRSLMAALGSGGAPLDFSLGIYDTDEKIYDGYFPGGGLHDGSGVGSGGESNLLGPDDYTEVIHRLPVSFSLTADFPIAEDMTLETGLSYTYLSSRYRRNDNFIYRGTLRQHYLGIPVNLRYTVWQNDVWNVYLLGGGSVEKGLRSIYKQEIEQNGGVVYHTNLYSRIKGLQFSAQGGAGFSYQLQGNLSLFGEPRIVYYFRNNQPMSARTENPLIFGLNMGIRLQFK